jgi:hypothetical protein
LVAEEGVGAGLEEVGAAFGEGKAIFANLALFAGAIDRSVDVVVGVGTSVEERDFTFGFDGGNDERGDAFDIDESSGDGFGVVKGFGSGTSE